MGDLRVGRALAFFASSIACVAIAACTSDDAAAPPPAGLDASLPPIDSSLPSIDAAPGHDAAAASDAAPDATIDATPPEDAAPNDASDGGIDATDASDAAPLGSYALQFSGAQYLHVPYAASLTGTSITVEAWVRLDVEPTHLFCAVCMPFGGGISDTYAAWVSQAVAGTSDNSATITAPFATPLRTWHHVAMTGDGTSGAHLLYVDGVKVQTSPTWNGAANQYDGHDLLLGADDDNGSLVSFLQGELDDVRVFSVVRSAAEIQGDMTIDRLGPTAGLVAEWTFDEGTGTIAHDSSGLGNDARFGDGDAAATNPAWVAVGSLPQPPAPSAGTDGGAFGDYALRFSGAEYVTIPDAWWSDPASITVEAWVRLEATPTFFCAACKPFGGGISDTVAMWTQPGVAGSSNNGTGFTGAWTSQTLGEWHHLAVTGNAANGAQLLYLDGAQVASSSTWNGAAGQWDSHPLLLGADSDNGSLTGFWQGEIDDVRVFSVVRGAAEIQADMAAHRLGPTPGLVGEWTFDEGSGQTSLDSSGFGNDARLGATTASEASDPAWVPMGSLGPIDAGHD